MDPLLIFGVIALALVALFLIVSRPTRRGPVGGREDRDERPELTGTEQHRQRKTR
jgi:hypothetical protein